jgi:hypothetical protein
VDDAPDMAGAQQRDPQPRQRFQGEQAAMHLEPGQLVSETSRPVPRAALSAGAAAGLLALRVFAVIVGLMVIYTFMGQLG